MLRMLRPLPIAMVAGVVGCSDSNAPRQSLRINFDKAPDSAAVIAGTVIDSVYASAGVTFKEVGPVCIDSANVFANSSSSSSAPTFAGNTVTTCNEGISSDISENGFGVVEVNLNRSAGQVCIDVAPDRVSDRAFLEVFNSGGASLGRDSSAAGATTTFCLTRTGIRRAHFSGNQGEFAKFDNLRITF